MEFLPPEALTHFRCVVDPRFTTIYGEKRGDQDEIRKLTSDFHQDLIGAQSLSHDRAIQPMGVLSGAAPFPPRVLTEKEQALSEKPWLPSSRSNSILHWLLDL